MIRFLHPEAFLLAVPLLVLLRFRLASRPTIAVLRGVLLLTLLALLAEPFVTSTEAGRDLVLLVDRSRSMPAETFDRVREVIDRARDTAEDGDRIAIVTFGRDAVVEVAQRPAESLRYQVPVREVDADATDLAAALDRGLALLPPTRRGTLLLISDGETTGRSPAPAARAALRRGVTIDVLPVRRKGVRDLAIEELSVPGEVALGEPFRFSAWIRSDVPVTAPFELLRDGEVIAKGVRTFRAGLERIVFHDRLGAPGIHRYELVVASDQDRVPQNDRAVAAVRTVGPERILVVSPNGRPGRLSRSLERTGLEIAVTAPRSAPLSLDGLDGFRAVVLENVPADDLPGGALEAIATWVRDLGGGLLMTGGEASFGPGGYHRTPVEDVLPVTMEIRQEQRRFSLALAIALDRSGSMQAAVGSGETKMDLANRGTVAAIELLGPLDSLAVIAVDSSAHVVRPMAPVEDRAAIIDRVRRIESMGGGIFVFTAIEAMAKELAAAPQKTKHMVLFADAADAEEPGRYADLVPKLHASGITLSVIALGDVTDQDAAFLLDLARLGGGRCKFVTDARHLPRVFAQETIQVARSSFARDPVEVDVLPDILGVGDLAYGDGFPAIGGYSIAYLQAGASVGLSSRDDIRAPLLSFWQRGLGRSAAYLGEVDGEFSGDVANWSGFTDFFATLARWLAGSRADEAVWADMRREGHEAVLSVELAEGEESRLETLRAVVRGPDDARTVWLRRVGERRLEARIPLSGAGVWRAAVEAGPGEVVRVPPVTLPYSPEFEPRPDPRGGEKLLTELAAQSGGRTDPSLEELWAGPRDSRGLRPLAPWLAWIAVLLLLGEIAARRLEWRPAVPRTVQAGAGRAVAAARRLVPSRPRPAVRTDAEAAPPPAETPRDSTPSRPGGDAFGSLLERARERARRRQ